MVHAVELESPAPQGSENGPIVKTNQYHHGNLREALIAAGLEMVERDGVESLTLRSVAKRINVSHSAPYHHFGSKAHLLAAVADAGFRLLVGAIDSELSKVNSPHPYERLKSVIAGYFRFALARPSLFRLMFRPELTRPDEYPFLAEAEARTFAILLKSIIACQAEGCMADCDPMPFAAFTWSTIHGLATLCIDRVILETPLRSMPTEDLLTQTVERILAGMGAVGPAI
ncbi:MAG: TetR/AcrR family transcriptional regulator [Planctomyces sp.]|nr:TetR/AcrR family transcriptional regulator [Planctomyces sp.]